MHFDSHFCYVAGVNYARRLNLYATKTVHIAVIVLIVYNTDIYFSVNFILQAQNACFISTKEYRSTNISLTVLNSVSVVYEQMV